MRNALMVVFCVSLFLCPVRASAQSPSYVSSALAYDFYNGQNQLYCFGEFFYVPGSGSYQWSGDVIRFTLTVVKYDSYAQYVLANPLSTTVTTYICTSGEWMVQQWNSTTVRVSGAKYLQVLDEGYFFDITSSVKAYGSYRPSPYSQWQSIVWDGEARNIQVDLTHP